MATRQADLELTPEAVVRTLTEQLETQATAGEWTQVENITAQLRGALLDVAKADRRALIIAVQRTTDKVAILAQDARSEVSDQIAALRRGQAAAKAYELR